jgi:hypothetical protein
MTSDDTTTDFEPLVYVHNLRWDHELGGHKVSYQPTSNTYPSPFTRGKGVRVSSKPLTIKVTVPNERCPHDLQAYRGATIYLRDVRSRKAASV